MRRIALACCTATVILAGQAFADVKLHSLFTEGAVLQQGVRVPVWGTAKDGERVSVSIQGRTASTVAEGGRWRVVLDPLKPGGPFELVVKGNNGITVKDVLVGEVWLAGGQSNMELKLSVVNGADAAIAASRDDSLRFFNVPRAFSDSAASDVRSSWQWTNPRTSGGFSAVAYFFARNLRKALGVPVGIINASLGATLADAWTPREAIAANPSIRSILDIPVSPQYPFHAPGCLYNGMICPLQPYAIKGVIWYQGEANTRRSHQYKDLLTTLITSWRRAWGQGDFPFLIVQLPPFENRNAPYTRAEVREAQYLVSKTVPRAGIVVTMDVGDCNDNHPRNKEPVGARLALAALDKAYGRRTLYNGPILRSATICDGKAIVEFASIGRGLEAKGDNLSEFELAGEDGRFLSAAAVVAGDRVEVSSPAVPKPVYVRFAWRDCPSVNLFNKDGFPAMPFRTDTFPYVTAAPKAEMGR